MEISCQGSAPGLQSLVKNNNCCYLREPDPSQRVFDVREMSRVKSWQKSGSTIGSPPVTIIVCSNCA
jgi:hypothetical protein